MGLLAGSNVLGTAGRVRPRCAAAGPATKQKWEWGGRLVVGFRRQEVDLVQGRDAHDLGGGGHIVELVEKRLPLLHRRDPEKGAGPLVGPVEKAGGEAARQGAAVAG